MDATLEASERLLVELEDIRSSDIGGPFTQKERDNCNKFLEIVAQVETALSAFHGLIVSAHEHIPAKTAEAITHGMRKLYFQLHEDLVPFAVSLVGDCRMQGGLFPALERFELSEKNIKERVDKYDSDNDELEELVFRDKVQAISPSGKSLKEWASEDADSQDWYNEDGDE